MNKICHVIGNCYFEILPFEFDSQKSHFLLPIKNKLTTKSSIIYTLIISTESEPAKLFDFTMEKRVSIFGVDLSKSTRIQN